MRGYEKHLYGEHQRLCRLKYSRDPPRLTEREQKEWRDVHRKLDVLQMKRQGPHIERYFSDQMAAIEAIEDQVKALYPSPEAYERAKEEALFRLQEEDRCSS